MPDPDMTNKRASSRWSLGRGVRVTRDAKSARCAPESESGIPESRRRRRLDLGMRWFSAVYLPLVLAAVVYYRTTATHVFQHEIAFGIYGAVVAIYLLTRFRLSLVSKPHPDAGLEPSIAIVMRSVNEEDAIATSMRSLLTVDYSAQKPARQIRSRSERSVGARRRGYPIGNETYALSNSQGRRHCHDHGSI